MVNYALLPSVVIFAPLGNLSKLNCSRLSQKLSITPFGRNQFAKIQKKLNRMCKLDIKYFFINSKKTFGSLNKKL